MTVEDFKINVRVKTKKERIQYWLQCIIGIGISIFSILYVNTKTDKLGNKIPIGVTYILIILLLIVIISVIQLLGKYRITTVLSNKSQEIKYAKIISALGRLPVISREESANFMHFVYQKNKWSIDFEIDLIYDENQICFVVIGRGYKDGGLIDFGRATKIRNLIISVLSSEFL